MSEKLAWLPLYVDDWLGSPTVARMSPAAECLYLRMLCRQWQMGSLPAGEVSLAALSGMTMDEFRGLWPLVARNFEPDPDTAELRNPRLAMIREEQLAKHQRMSEAGRRGGLRSGEARRSKASSPPSNPPSSNQNQNQNQNQKKTPPLTPPWGDGLDPRIEEACEAWAAYRRESRRRAWAPRSWKAALKKHGEGFPEAVEHSIANGYAGVFPPGGNRLADQSPKRQDWDEYRRQQADLDRQIATARAAGNGDLVEKLQRKAASL